LFQKARGRCRSETVPSPISRSHESPCANGCCWPKGGGIRRTDHSIDRARDEATPDPLSCGARGAQVARTRDLRPARAEFKNVLTALGASWKFFRLKTSHHLRNNHAQSDGLRSRGGNKPVNWGVLTQGSAHQTRFACETLRRWFVRKLHRRSTGQAMRVPVWSSLQLEAFKPGLTDSGSAGQRRTGKTT
jgi:hypothetical protein